MIDSEVLPFKGLHSGGRPKIDLSVRFEAKIAPANEQGCRLWIGRTSKRRTTEDRVGKITRDQIDTQAHIIMWDFAYHEYPKRQIKPIWCRNWLCMESTHWSMVRDRTPKMKLSEVQALAVVRDEQYKLQVAERKSQREQAGKARKVQRSPSHRKRRWGGKKQT